LWFHEARAEGAASPNSMGDTVLDGNATLGSYRDLNRRHHM